MNCSPQLKSFAKFFLLRLLAVSCATALCSAAKGQGLPGKDPFITGIQLDGNTVTISARVPAGLKKVTLQSSRRLGTGAWEPRAVLRLDGQGGDVTFQVPRSPALEIVRVRADNSEPLPSLFFRGTNLFPGIVLSTSTTDPNSLVFAAPGAAAPGSTVVDNQAAVDPTAASRDVVESDIWEIRGNVLYFFNQYRGLQVIDITDPDSPVLRGTLSLPAVGEQMYLLPDGTAVLLARNDCGTSGVAASQVLVVRVGDGAPSVITSLPLSGQIQESRLVGSALYVMTQTYQPVPNAKDGAWEWGTGVASFDLSNPTAPVSRSTLWLTGYGNVLSATDQALFISVSDATSASLILHIDITAPDGTMQQAAPIRAAGNVTDKFKMNLQGDIFTVISEQWSWQTPNQTGRWRPVTRLETFSLSDPAAPRKLGELQLADGEQLHATRFDGNRVYVVTFFQVDPLWVVDLTDPTKPAIRGEVQVPGWSTYIQPYGDRLVTIGIDNSNSWRVAVSLFDVHDPAAPALLGKVPLGENSSWSEANYDEKAFGFLPDAGLILVPFSTYSTNTQEGVQLIDFNQNSLLKRGFITHDLPARRSTVAQNRILSISGRELLTVDASDRDKPLLRSQTALAWGVDRVFVQGEYLVELESASAYGGTAQPALRIASVANSEQIVNDLPLGNLPVLGAALRDGRLYLLQGNPSYSGPIYFATDESAAGASTNAAHLLCSVVDVSKLPQIQVIGSTDLTVSEVAGSSALALWPKPDLLVWSTQQATYWPLRFMPVAIGGGAMPIIGGFWPPFSNYGGSQLLALDVADPVVPKFLSEVNLTSTNGWASYSKPFAADSSVFIGHQVNETSITGTNYFTTTNTTYVVTNDSKVPVSIILTNEQPIYTSRQLSDVDVVDYTAPAHPVVRQPVTVPGALQGISKEGAVLYLVGPTLSSDSPSDGKEWLYACAYDGVACYLVDSHALPEQWPHPVLVQDPNLFIARPDVDKTSSRALEIWTLSDGGKFTKLNERNLASNASSLQVIGDLLVAQEDTGLELFQLNPASEWPLVGAAASSNCLGWNLDAAAGSFQDGLWLPLGLYGVELIPLKK